MDKQQTFNKQTNALIDIVSRTDGLPIRRKFFADSKKYGYGFVGDIFENSEVVTSRLERIDDIHLTCDREFNNKEALLKEMLEIAQINNMQVEIQVPQKDNPLEYIKLDFDEGMKQLNHAVFIHIKRNVKCYDIDPSIYSNQVVGDINGK